MSKINFRSLALALVVPVTGLGILTAPSLVTTAQVSENSRVQEAKLRLFQSRGIPPESLTVVKEATLADTGITRFKMRDSQGKIYNVSIDASGNPVNEQALRQAVEAIENKGFEGKIEAELAKLLGQRSNNTAIDVVILLKGETVAPIQRNVQTRAQLDANLTQIRSVNAAKAKPLMNQLQGNNQQIIYRSDYAPVVVARVTPEMIEKMAARSDVERIYLEGVGAPRLDVSRVVVQANTVNNRGFSGGGQKVGVVEPDRIGNHPNLPAAQRVLCRPESSTIISDHKTEVAGVIQSTDATDRGIAPAITIIDGIGADYSDSEMIAATDCVISKGASAINFSFGSETDGSFDAWARYVDEVIYNARITVSISISNFCELKMGSPEVAFNLLAVGAFGDNNTTNFSDDIAACTRNVNFSAFLDPDSPNNDREEPDIVAPADQIMMPTSGGGFVNSSGTSFAAPHVTGGVGLLRQRKAALFSQPEEVRAILMASARHNIEGSSRLSERDGAGAIMLAAADKVAANGLSKFFSNNGAASKFPINSTFTADSGQKVRVAIAWAHKMPAGSTSTQPTTDLDLTVKQPNGSAIATSASLDNNYEIVEFTAPVKGTYTAVISNSRASTGTEYIGLAVSKTNS